MTNHRAFVLLFFLALTLAGCKQEAKGPAAAGPPVVPVSAVQATRESAPTEVRVVGSAEASAIVQVKSQVAGELVRVAFAEGQNVAQGDLLFQIDPRPFEQAVRQAEAAAGRDRAQVAQAEASLARDQAQARFAESDAARYGDLQKEGLASRSQTDQSRAGADVARESARATQATIESARAALASDMAAIESARLNLSYCEIHAPLAGRTGNLLVQAGNLVKVNDAPLVVIHRITPIFVNFNVPEQRLESIRRLSAGGRKLAVRAFPREDSARGAEGSLAVIDNTVDASTGTIRLKAAFENRDGLLWPGEFVNVVLTLDTVRDATMVPAEAVQSGQRGQYVYVVKADGTVENRMVTQGAAVGGKMIIEKGVTPGEMVVTDGHLMLFPGAKVKLVDAAKVGAGPL
jgi:multidrug efflux system membrane fusion protein